MAGRVNTKFVILLSSVIVLIVLAVAGVYVFKVMRSADDLIRQGDVHLAEGQPRMAIESYGRAVSKRPDDVALLQKYVATLQTIDVKDLVEANTFLGHIRSGTRQAAEADPSNLSLLRDYYELELDLAERLGGRAFYNEVYRLTSIRLEQDPTNPVARRYRGIAQVHRLSFEMPRDEQLQVYEDLLQTYEADPQDARVAHGLAQWSLFEAERLERTSGAPQDIQKLRDNALAISQQMLAQAPDDLRRQLYHLEILLDPKVDKVEEAAPIAESIEADLLQDPQPESAVRTMVQALPRLDKRVIERDGQRDTTAGIQRAQRLLEAAIEHDPANVLYRTILGRVYVMQGERDRAIQQFAQVWDMGTSAPAIDAIRANGLRLDAGLQEMDLRLSQLEGLSPQERDEVLLAAERRVEQVEQTSAAGETGMTHLIRGKVALIRRHFGEAMQSLDQAARMLAGSPQEGDALLLSARARRLSGERGAAADQLETLVERLPGSVPLRLELAELYVDMKQVEEARVQVDHAMAIAPDDPKVKLLNARLLALTGKTDQAIAAFESLDIQAHPEVLMSLAQLYAVKGDQQKVQQLVQDRFEQSPQDVRALSLMLQFTDDQAQQLQLIERSRAAGGNATTLDLMQRQVTSGQALTRQDLINELIEQQDDPVLRELAQATIHRRSGDMEQYRAALDRAAGHDADHPRVVEMQFELAVSEQRWDDASRVAARAGSLDLDLAGGAFFRGQLAAAQGHLEEAIAEYRRGLSARPVYSEGWRRIGDVQARTGNMEAAADAYRRALDQRPDNTRAIRGLASIADGQGNHARALQLIKDALRHDSNDPELLAMYLTYEQQHGDPEEAMRLRQQLAEANPGDLRNRRALALLLAQREQVDEAMAVADALLAEHGATLANVQTAASVQAIAGQVDTGRGMLEQYIAQRGEEATAQDLVALARYNLAADDAEGTIDAYTRARQKEDPDTRPVTRELADLFFARGAIEQALPLYRELHQQDADDPVIGLRYAETLVRAGEHEQAQALLEQYPDQASGRVLEAVLAMNQQDRTGAIEALEQGLRIDPQSVLVRVQLASLLAENPAQTARARDLLSQAMRIAPNAAEARLAMASLHQQLGEIPEAIRELRTVLSQQPGNRAVRLRLVDLYTNRQETSAARSLLEQGAAQEPDNPVWPRLMSQLALRSGNMNEAVTQARRALEMDASPQQVVALATLLIEADQPADALALLDEHPALVNAEAAVQGIRGLALARTGQTEPARQVFIRAMERSQNLGQALNVAGRIAQALGTGPAVELLASIEAAPQPLWIQLAAADVQLKGGEHSAAADRLRAAAQTAGVNDDATREVLYRMLAAALHQAGDAEGARQAYERVLELRPDDVATLNNLAYLLVENLDQPQRSLEFAQRAADLSPNNPQILDTLGWAQFKAGQVDAARATLERSIEIQPLAPNCYHLARVYAGLGVTASAREHVKQAIELAQQHQDAAVLPQAQALLEELGS